MQTQLALHGIRQAHGKCKIIMNSLLIALDDREDKKLKIDVVKQYFQTFLVDNEWLCKKGELRASELENLSGEVIRHLLKISREVLLWAEERGE